MVNGAHRVGKRYDTHAVYVGTLRPTHDEVRDLPREPESRKKISYQGRSRRSSIKEDLGGQSEMRMHNPKRYRQGIYSPGFCPVALAAKRAGARFGYSGAAVSHQRICFLKKDGSVVRSTTESRVLLHQFRLWDKPSNLSGSRSMTCPLSLEKIGNKRRG